jgi:hypothetical protein
MIAMRSSSVGIAAAMAVVVSGLGGVTASWAAPPGNDNRADAQVVRPPERVTGTLVEATQEFDGLDLSRCSRRCSDASVWYRFTAPKQGAIVIELDAAGDMDASVDLYERVRSQLNFVDCDVTDRQGIATIDNDNLTGGDEYAIRVGKEVGSVADSFALRVLIPSPPPEPPGKPLPAKGVKDSVDRLSNAGDAFATQMLQGRTMRLSLRSKTCTRLDVYGPGTRRFGGEVEKVIRCGGYALFTPRETGRYSLVVTAAGRTRGTQRYKLRVAPARRDDTTPGVFIRNNAKVTGKVNLGIDTRDLYRFDVTRRSTLTLKTSGDTDMRLVRQDGRYVDGGEIIERQIAAGRYYVAVEGSGRYTLRRVSRTITRSTLRVNRRRTSTVAPGRAARLALRVRPAVDGRAVIEVQRLDPIEGWQFQRRYRVSVRSGAADVSYSPPTVGRYRFFAEYRGTRTAAPSSSATARLRVQGPLIDAV